MLGTQICETTPLMHLAHENLIPQSGQRHAVRSVWALCLLIAVLLPTIARADGEDPLLWLAVQRGTALDRVASELVREQLAGRKEFKIIESTLSEVDRRCRTAPCLSALARQHQAFVVLSGDVFQVGSKQNQRVVMHLYDGRHRQVFDVENLCTDCDETKLGLMIQSTLGEILGRYRKGQDADVQLNELLDGAAKNGPPAIPAPGADPVMVAPLLPTTAPALAPTPAQVVGTQPDARPQLAPIPAARPAQTATVPLAPTSVATQPVTQPAMTLPPPLPPAGQVQTQTYMPQLPSAATQYPQPGQAVSPPAFAWQPTPTPQPERKGLSARRKALAGVFGSLGIAILGGSIAAHYLDKKLDSSLAINATGLPCTAGSNAGQNCVLTTIGLWAPGYAVSGLMLGGMILSLAVPEK
jgi:hypothetical protein